tara:strand:- start:189 stop:497 length:309 start_codon:yes stop_codon:yes gene_type:complete
MKRYCLNCAEKLEGRRDKKYCDKYCKSQYHYEKNRLGNKNRYQIVLNQLKNNRRILAKFNKAGMAKVSGTKLLDDRFDCGISLVIGRIKKGMFICLYLNMVF